MLGCRLARCRASFDPNGCAAAPPFLAQANSTSKRRRRRPAAARALTGLIRTARPLSADVTHRILPCKVHLPCPARCTIVRWVYLPIRGQINSPKKLASFQPLFYPHFDYCTTISRLHPCSSGHDTFAPFSIPIIFISRSSSRHSLPAAPCFSFEPIWH